MAKSAGPITFRTVRTMGLKLPGAEVGTVYGSPALTVNGRMFACIAINKSVEPETLAVRVPLDQRKDLLADAPDTFYLTPHYADYPIVLVRLARVRRDALGDLLQMAHRLVAAEEQPTRKNAATAKNRKRP